MAADEGQPLRARVRANRRSLELTAFIIVLFGIDFLWSSHTANQVATAKAQVEQQAIAVQQRAIEAQQKAITSSCDFIRPLTTLPVTVNPQTNTASKLSVQIVAGAREQYAAQCTPPEPALAPADPSLVRWAKFYHITVPDPP